MDRVEVKCKHKLLCCPPSASLPIPCISMEHLSCACNKNSSSGHTIHSFIHSSTINTIISTYIHFTSVYCCIFNLVIECYIFSHSLATLSTYVASLVSSMCRVNMHELQKAMYSDSSSLVREPCLDLYQACIRCNFSVSSSNLTLMRLAMVTNLLRMSRRHAWR